MSLTILIIDDDPAAIAYHKIMIAKTGNPHIIVKEYHTVDEAIAYLKDQISMNGLNNWPDFIFVDLNIPVKNGWVFIEEYKRLGLKNKKTKVYVVTNSENPRDLEKANSIPEIDGLKTKFLSQTFFEELFFAHS